MKIKPLSKRIFINLSLVVAFLLLSVAVYAQTAAPLRFRAVNGDVTIAFDIRNATHTIQYSTNGTSWTNYTSGTQLTCVSTLSIYFRAQVNQSTAVAFGAADAANCSHFSFSSTNGGMIECTGDIMSLYGPNAPDLNLPAYAFAGLFSGCSLITTAPTLSATTMGDNCYKRMFQGCSSLPTAPALNAMNLAYHCYDSMFCACTSLTTPPALPATTLAEGCYRYMFTGCTSLQIIPTLPASLLVQDCYQYMFNGCSSLTVNTEGYGITWSLEAMDLLGSCAFLMFNGTAGTMNTTPSLSTTYYIPSITHNVTLSVNNPLWGSVTGDGTYIHGQTAMIIATPAEHYHLVNWSNGETTDTINVVVTSDTSLTATFGMDTCSAVGTPNDAQGGSVTGSGRYEYGATVSLVAHANPHYHFVSWSNGATADSISLVLTQDTTLTANFAIDTFTITAVPNSMSLGTVTGSGRYTYGQTATLIATPVVHYHLDSWNFTLTGDTLQVVVTQDSLFIAFFAIDTLSVMGYATDPSMGSVDGSDFYDYGATVTLVAKPAPHYHFLSWNNGETSDSLTFVLTQDTVFYASFEIDTHQLTVETSDTTQGTVTGTGRYDWGTSVTIIATPKPHYHFVSWSNGETTDTLAILLTKDSIVTANFALDSHTLNVFSNDTLYGIVTGSGTYEYGTQVIISATAADHYQFVAWSNGETATTISIILTGDSDITAFFALGTHIMRAMPNNSAYGTVSGSGTYSYGDTVTLVATPAAHYHFVSWNNGSTTDTIRVVLVQDTLFVAHFAIDTHTLTVLTNDTVYGSVTGSGTYDYGTSVTLTATANPHYHFVSWSNGETTTSITIVLTQDTTLTANFDADLHNVTVLANNPTYGTTSGSGAYNFGDTVTIVAIPAANYHFVAWNNGVTADTIRFVVTQDTTFIANFAIDNHTLTVLSSNNILGLVTGSGTYANGTIVTITATPVPHCNFLGWSNGETADTLNVTLTSDSTLTALFVGEPLFVTASSNNASYGTVTGGGTYAYGDTVTLVATPVAGHHFVMWSNGETSDTLRFMLTCDTMFMAYFDTSKIYTVVASANYPYMGEVTGSGFYAYGETATLTATPNDGYVFVNWDNGSTDSVISITVTTDILIFANFAPVSGVDEVSEADYVAYVEGNRIYVSGAEGKAVAVYDVNGRLIGGTREASSLQAFDVRVSGVYIVCVENINIRVLVY